jgi:glycine hydroxymethyltransferase
VGAYLMADIAHIAGFIATGMHQSPMDYAHVVTSTTHKTLRGPRGGLILSNDEELGKKLNLALFPGLQGGPLMHVIAAKAVAFGEALLPEYKTYMEQVLKNSRAMTKRLQDRGYDSITSGTDNHMTVLDLRGHDLNGRDAANSMDRAGITCNKNTVPFDPTSPFVTSGVRLGSPACTTRGFKEEDFVSISDMIADVLDGLKASPEDNGEMERRVRITAQDLCDKYPL